VRAHFDVGDAFRHFQSQAANREPASSGIPRRAEWSRGHLAQLIYGGARERCCASGVPGVEL